MKQVTGPLRLDLAQFRDLEAFATFGSELDKVSQAQLDRGYRLVELLKQPLHAPLPVEEQVAAVFAGTRGFLDDVAVEDVRRFESEMLEYLRSRHAEVLDAIRTTGALADEGTLAKAIEDFKELFSPSAPSATPSGPSSAEADA